MSSHPYDDGAEPIVIDTRKSRGAAASRGSAATSASSTSANSTRAQRSHSAGHARTLGRSLGLTALGTVIPGAGLAAAGRRRSGLTLLGVFVVAAVVLAIVAVSRGLVATVLDLVVSDTALIILSVVVGVAVLAWILSIIATHVATRPRRAPQGAAVGAKVFTGVMCLLVLLPGIKVIQYASIQRDLVNNLFAGKQTTPGSTSAATTNAPDRTQSDPWAKTPRINVLLIGSDAGSDRTGVRTDSMIVASINTKTGNTVLFGLPRNLERVHFSASDPLSTLWPNGYNCGDVCLLNAVWTEAEAHKSLFKGDKNPGLTATSDAISQTLGLSIDNTAVIDLAGFTALVDAMGGVTVTVPQRIPIGGSHLANGAIAPGSIKGWIEKGTQHLNGYKALWFSRSRATTDDYSRMLRQRCMVGALLKQVNPVSMLGKYPQLAEVAKKNINVDIAAGDLPAWVTLVQRIQGGKITSLPFTSSNTNVVNPDFAKIRSQVQKSITASGTPAKAASSSTSTTKKPTTTKAPASDVSTVC